MSTLRVNNNTYYSKLIFCVCTFILFNLTNNYNVVFCSVMQSTVKADNSNQNKNISDENSTERLSLLLKSEIKYLFQDHLTVIPLENNQVLKDQATLDHHEPLNYTSAVHFLQCLYRNNGRRNELDDPIFTKDDEYAYNDTDVIISVVGEEIDNLDDVTKDIDRDGEYIHFNVTKVRKNRIAQFGSLRLFKDNENSIPWDDSILVSIELYEVKKLKFNRTLHFITKTVVKRDYKGWMILKMTELFQKWSRHPEKNYGVHLDVVVETKSGNKYYKLSDIGVVGIGARNKKGLLPFAVGFFKKSTTLNDRDLEKKSRRRRDLTELFLEKSYHAPKVRKELGGNSECGVRKFDFSFADFGWDEFVIAPSFFDLSYCAGACPTSQYFSGNLPIHSYLQILAHDIHPNKISPPCCAPTKLHSISLLYYGHKDNILLEKMEQMSISKCNCL